jgi:hypothetical protein
MMQELAITIAIKKFFIALTLTVTAFFLPLKPLLIGSLILVLIDLYTGVKSAKKRGEKIQSKGYKRTLIKFRDYALLIITAHLMTTIFFPNLGVDFASLASMAIAYVEFRSFCENMEEITGNSFWMKIFAILPEFNFFQGKTTKGDDAKL